MDGTAEGYLSVWTGLDRAVWSEDELRCNLAFISRCRAAGDTQTKYLGKYAFIRVLHAQEIMSALFSLLSAAAALYCYREMGQLQQRCRKAAKLAPGTPRLARAPPPGAPVAVSLETRCRVIRGTFLLQVATWGSSCLFHFRDCYPTQCLDYLCAIGSILAMLGLSCLGDARRFKAAVIAGLLLFAGHSYYLLGVEFNFQYNTAICGALFAATVWRWCRWYQAIQQSAHSRLLKLGIIGMAAASAFQAIDFGPIFFLLDSHAVWHLLGLIYSLVLYRFFLEDTEYLMGRSRGVE